ncbi:MAG: hypothetical protein JO221_00755 [Sphingomonas sp.]|nr:hypothetical protein [Sphingomonas sp.]
MFARLPLILLPLALFLALFDPATLEIGNVGWLIRGTDNGENALGTHAYLHDPAAGASARTRLLNAPDGVPVLFTDSNPLVTLAAKPFAALLPADAQLVGPWLLACLFLQIWFAWLLLRRHAPDTVSLWCGVLLLAATPTLVNRYIHANLFAHWLILCALWLFTDPRRARAPLYWAGLLAIAALVHNYLLVLVAAIWASAVLLTAWQAAGRDRLGIALAAAATLGGIGLLEWWLGAGGHFAVTGTYGYFAMPLDALWNPANPGYGTLLPAIPQREGRGIEGFQYLGLGVLLLVPVALYAAAKNDTPHEPTLRRLIWLAPAFALLTLVAISNFPDMAGTKLARFALPDAFAPWLDMVRASGRLFWPVAYTLIFALVLLAFRLPGRQAPLALATALAIQILDTAGIAQAVRSTSAEAGRRIRYVRTLDPRWDSAIAAARDISFVPAVAERDLALYQEVAWRAIDRRRPMRLVYAARKSHETEARLAAETADFAAGRLDPGRLYVLVGAAKAPPGARTLMLDGVTLVVPRRMPR